MSTEMRKTGLDVVGDMPWGTHFCLFYETRDDLLETLVSYCKVGLENQEFCLWVVAEPLTGEDARHALERAVPDLDRYLADQSIEIVAARDWYLQDGTFDLNRVISGWNEKLARASAKGYAGVRVTGDTAWLEKKDWKDFCEYEESLNQAVANQRLAVLCTYPLAACGAAEILDVVRTHQFAVTKRRGDWDVIETAGHKQAKAEIKRLNEELEQRVLERTSQLMAVNTELTKEVLQRQRAEEALQRSEAYLAEAQRISHTGSFGWSVPSGHIVWSEETFRIFEYDPAQTSTVGAILQRTHPEDRAFVQETIDQAALDRKAFDFEHRLLVPDGSVKYVRVVAHPSTNDESGSVEFVGAVMDITERKRAEEALRRSESNLAEAQRLTHTGSWVGTHGDIRHWSEECYRVLGFDPQEGLPPVETFFGRFHPDDRARTMEQLERASREKTDFEFDYRIIHPGGGIRDIHTIGHPVFNPSGDLVEFVGTVIDVTDRKRAEEALLRSEGNLAQAQRLTQSGSWAWNVRTDARFWSEETFRIFGYDPEQVKPTWSDILERVHPEDRAAIVHKAKMETTLKEDSEFDWRIVLPDGTIKHLHSIAHPVMDESGEVSEIVGTLMDVTERKRAEALREAESRMLEMIARDARLEDILENLVRVVEAQFAGLLCSVLLLDEDGQHVRHGAAPSLPKPYSEAIDGLRIGPKAGSCGTAMYRREPVVVTDILHDPLWEGYRDVAAPYGLRACWSTPILSHSGNALGSFAMYYREPRSPSSAETRALEMATHLAGIAIERKLARDERERLRQAQADLAHINRVTTMGELTASLAHEIRQPIAAAVTNAKTCLRWLGRDDPDVSEAREAASRLVMDVTRAADLISRIRLLFQKGAPQHELVDVNELIQEMIVLLRGEAVRHSISIRSHLGEGLPKVMADRIQLQQVFMNLMLNGIESMKDCAAGELTISSQQVKDSQLRISVSDTGVGLPPQQAEQIFSAFFTTKSHGTGMGLPISRSIIESHGGRLWATSNSAQGASFHFTLPSEVESRHTSAQSAAHRIA
jgi:PAS domain S-box-containing protein